MICFFENQQRLQISCPHTHGTKLVDAVHFVLTSGLGNADVASLEFEIRLENGHILEEYVFRYRYPIFGQ